MKHQKTSTEQSSQPPPGSFNSNGQGVRSTSSGSKCKEKANTEKVSLVVKE